MNYSKIKKVDIANGPGCRTSIWLSGCRNNCRECFNPDLWDFKAGKVLSDSVIDEVVETLKPEYIAGLTILGGEPLEPENQQSVLKLIMKVRERFPKKTIWVYTGFTWETLLEGKERCCTNIIMDILQNIDILVDGPFQIENKQAGLPFRGSSNQRFIQTKLSLKLNSLILDNYEQV